MKWSSCMNFLTLEAGEAIYVPADCPRKYSRIKYGLKSGEKITYGVPPLLMSHHEPHFTSAR